jgi:signal transduction histidine kinase/ActR/RegA family two-component response regulator/CHASE3 domain sensor protein
MSIRGRVVKMFTLMGTLMLVQIALVIYLQREGGRMRDAADATGTTVEHLDESLRYLLEMQSAERGYAAIGERGLLDDYAGAARDYTRHRDAAYARLDPEGRQELTRIDGMVQAWIRGGAAAMTAARDQGTTGAAALVRDSGQRWALIDPAMERLEAREYVLLDHTQSEADVQARRATTLMVLIPILCTLALVYLSVDATVRTLRPMAALGRAAQHIAKGEFVVPPPAGFGGEIAVVRDAFEHMAAAIQRREKDLNDAVARERSRAGELRQLKADLERQRADLLAVLETTPAAILLFDPTGRLLLRNKAADAVHAQLGFNGHGPASVDEARGQLRLMKKDGSDAPVEQWPVTRALAGETVLGWEMQIAGPNGQAVPILSSAAPLRDEAGRITGAVVAFQDTSRLHEVDRMKDDFVSVVSHELRTPLTSIRGGLQLALADDDAVTDPAVRQLLTVALNNSERLTRIVNDILDIAKIESGGLPLDTRTCRVEELLRVAWQSVERIATAADVRLASRLAPDLRPVRVDFDRGVQTLVNLLSNAIKFAPPGSEVTVEGVNRDGGLVAISVCDRGAGISQDDLSRLFQKFKQVDSSASRRVGGTGLGLVITKALIEQHGGHVEVESEVGRGSTFTIVLPAATAPETAPPPPEGARPAASERSSDRPRPRVLVAEDDGDLLIVLAQALTRSGCEVVTARDGRDAWMMATAHPPDLLLLDLAMPQMDGFEVIRRVRAAASSHDVPIVAMSGSDRRGPSELRARELGANSFLAKPLDANDLVHEVHRLLAASPTVP